MIAPLGYGVVAQTTHQLYLERLVESGFAGNSAPGYASRTELATGNSIYQGLPQAVHYPHDADHLVGIARLDGREASRDIVLTPRGLDPSTKAQTLTDWLPLADFGFRLHREDHRLWHFAGLATGIHHLRCGTRTGRHRPNLHGHAARNRATSGRIYYLSWWGVAERLTNAGRLLTTGHSYLSQVKRLSRMRLPHPS